MNVKRITTFLILAAATAFPMENAVFIDSDSRLGYEWVIRDWLRAGLATSIYFQGETVDIIQTHEGQILGSVDTRANIGIIAPSIDMRATAYEAELHMNPYLSFHDGGPPTAWESRTKEHLDGNWAGADFYLARTFTVGHFEFRPAFFLLRYGFCFTEKFHSLGYGFLPEGRLAFRF